MNAINFTSLSSNSLTLFSKSLSDDLTSTVSLAATSSEAGSAVSLAAGSSAV